MKPMFCPPSVKTATPISKMIPKIGQQVILTLVEMFQKLPQSVIVDVKLEICVDRSSCQTT